LRNGHLKTLLVTPEDLVGVFTQRAISYSHMTPHCPEYDHLQQ
jgi:hypothetical protein